MKTIPEESDSFQGNSHQRRVLRKGRKAGHQHLLSQSGTRTAETYLEDGMLPWMLKRIEAGDCKRGIHTSIELSTYNVLIQDMFKVEVA
jgi:hypothetical protein